MVPIYVRTSTYTIELRRFWYSMSFNSLLNSASFAYEIDQTTYPQHLQCALSPWKIAALLCRISIYDSVLKALIWVPRASFHFALKALIWASRVLLTPTSPILRSEYQTPGVGPNAIHHPSSLLPTGRYDTARDLFWLMKLILLRSVGCSS